MPERSSNGADREPVAARWSGRYLALVAFGVTLTSTLLGLLIAATLALSNANHSIDEHRKLLDSIVDKEKAFAIDMINVDHRLNEGATNLSNSERREDAARAVLSQSIAVLDAQLKMFAERSVSPAPKGSSQ